ncbi:MAG: RluA family pseudouridine synthase [Pirellulales bacterium]
MSTSVWPLNVLYEDNHLLVVCKPVMLPTMGVADDRPSLLAIAKAYIKQKYDKPGNVYLGIVSRLDAPVSGAVAIARTSKAASRLSRQFRDQSVEKIYWAVVEGTPDPQQGRLIDYVRKDERHRRMHLARPDHQGARQARLSYRTLATRGSRSLLEVRLETGRKHQIRLQLAAQGHPIMGDRKYGSRRPFSEGIALHCRTIEFEHPVRRQPLRITAPFPPSWRQSGFSDRCSLS